MAPGGLGTRIRRDCDAGPGALRDELAQRYEDCGRIWEDDAAGRAAAPDQIEPGHAPCSFTATPRSMEELASW